MTKPTTHIGIDGCKGGWLVAILQDKKVTIHLKSTISEVWKSIQPQSPVLIDMPIGLLEGENGKTIRACDAQARKLLAKKSSSIFPVPCRQAVYTSAPEKTKGWYATWHQKVSQLNRKYLGKGLPIQSLGILSKIRELDEFIVHQKQAKMLLLEAHPELCFKLLKGDDLAFNKKEAEGQQERIALLSSYIINFDQEMFDSHYATTYPKSKVLADDILDAICLAVHAKLGTLYGFSSLGNELDSKGIPMAISYGNH